MFTLRRMTPEESAEQARLDAEHHAEELRRWPMSQRRPRCCGCGAFMPTVHCDHTKCKACGQSWLDLQ